MLHVNVDVCSRRILEHTCTIVCVVGEVIYLVNSIVRWEKEVALALRAIYTYTLYMYNTI